MTYVISHDIFLEPRALALRARESIAPFGGENKTRTGAHPCRGRHVPTWMHGRRWVMLTLLRIARLGEHNPPRTRYVPPVVLTRRTPSRCQQDLYPTIQGAWRRLRRCASTTTGTPLQSAGLHSLHLPREEHATAATAHVHDTPTAAAGRHQRGGVTAAEARTCTLPLFAWSPAIRLHPSPCAGGLLCRRAAVGARNRTLACSAPC